MKHVFKNLLVLCAGLALTTACETDEELLQLNPTAVPVVTVSSQNVVLTKENADKEALTVTWQKPDYGFNAAAAYTIQIDKKGGNFANAAAMPVAGELKKTFRAGELNDLLLSLGLAPGTAADVDVRVQSVLGPVTTLNSAVSTIKVTPYLNRLDLSTNWGVVGSAAANGWDGPDMPFFRTDKANVFVAYVTLKDGEIKFRQNNKWDVNYGDNGANGSLEAGGANIAVKAGSYRITFDLGAMTYKIDRFSWGVVGSAAPNGWNGPDAPFMYDPSSDQWRAIVTLKAGEIKFRQNNAWDTNFGDDGANGSLEAGGANIAVAKAGTYLITVDFKNLKYTIEPFKAWGIVGSATASGWDGPDAKFTPDFANEGVWNLNGITLKAGEIKFRQNDAWDVNLGDNGADGTLEAGGENIKVTAGTYDIQLNLSNASRMTYKLTKK